MDRDVSRWAFAAVAALVGLPVVWIADRLTGGGPGTDVDRLATAVACTLAAWLVTGLLLSARAGLDSRHLDSRRLDSRHLDSRRWDTLVIALGTVFAQLAGHTILFLLHSGPGPAAGCLPAVGRGAEAGVDLALLRPEAACPPGTAAAGPTLLAVWAAFAVAVVILVGHAVVAAAAGLVLAAGSASVRVLRTLGDVLLARLPELTARPVAGRPRVRARSTRVPLVWRQVAPARRRGPPAFTTA